MSFLRKTVLEWNKPLGRPECPYAYRFRIDFYWFSFRLHYWVGDDDSRAYHDHPINFITLIIWGGYLDIHPRNGKSYARIMGIGSMNLIRRHYQHYVKLIRKPTISLLFTWGKPEKYGFYNTETGRRTGRDWYFKKYGRAPCDTNK